MPQLPPRAAMRTPFTSALDTEPLEGRRPCESKANFPPRGPAKRPSPSIHRAILRAEFSGKDRAREYCECLRGGHSPRRHSQYSRARSFPENSARRMARWMEGLGRFAGPRGGKFAFDSHGRRPSSGSVSNAEVNGVRIAARGGSWGMDDSRKRVSRERLEPYFRLHREANVNIIRNWVGQSTEEAFFELADEYGLMVWNDFWASTQDYNVEPEDPALFIENARDT